MQLKPDTFFLVFLFVLPGFLAHNVIQSLVKKQESSSATVTTYRSLLHSVAIYTIVYPLLVLFLGVDFLDAEQLQTVRDTLLSNRWFPILAVLGLSILSFVWALLCVVIIKYAVPQIQKIFGMAVEPPNVYASIFNPTYKKSDDPNKYWVTVQIGDQLVEGGVVSAVTDGATREFYITNVAYLDPETREVIIKLPEETGAIINLDNMTLTEVTSINQ